MSSIGYPVNYSLATFVLVASQANVANARYREINVQPRKKVFGLFRLRHVNDSATINATGRTQSKYAIISYFVRFRFLV